MTKREFLTRSCTVCGIEKPLSAFLQITGKQGTVYGAICFSCRSAGKTEKSESTHEDERSSTSPGLRIGAKQRLEIELKQKRDYREKQDTREEFAKKHEKTLIDSSERLEQQEKAEKTHRETFIEEKKKQAFLNYKSKTLPVSIKTLIGQTRNEQAAKTPIAEDKLRIEESNRKEDAVKKQEERVTTLDGAPILMNSLLRDNPTFREYIARLPRDSPIVKAFTNKEETPRDFIEKNWGPSSRK